MSDDEFDELSRAPSPAHERHWRHPAELADAERTAHLSVPPPPLSRRLTALTASISIIASVAVLGVAIPKGISTYSEEVDDITRTSPPFPLLKNAATNFMATATSNKGTTSAISMGRGYWVVAIEAIDPRSPLSISSSGNAGFPAHLVSSDASSGIALLKTDITSPTDQAPDLSAVIEPSSIKDFSMHRVIDATATQTIIPSASLSTQQMTKDIPITTADEIHGIALVIDSAYHTIGIVVRRGHALWMLQKSTVNRLMRTASGG